MDHVDEFISFFRDSLAGPWTTQAPARLARTCNTLHKS